MQRIRLLVLLLLCVVCQQTFAQQRTISGLVISAEDHEPLIGATISVQGNEAHGVVTDIDGKYTLFIDKFPKLELELTKQQVLKLQKEPLKELIFKAEQVANLKHPVNGGILGQTTTSILGNKFVIQGSFSPPW